jgi:hypothetical protein
MIKLFQHRDGTIDLSIKHGSRNHTDTLTPDQAMTLSNKLQSFAKAQQGHAFWELPHE